VTLKVIEQAHAFGLDMVKFPNHTSHTLQPLDVSCFKPFKRTFKKESNNAKIKKKKILRTKQDKVSYLGKNNIRQNIVPQKYQIWIQGYMNLTFKI
jgi:hypothetical protein